MGFPCAEDGCAAELARQTDPSSSMTCDEPQIVFGREWKRCAWRCVNDDREISAVRSIRSAASMSPLRGWPDEYSAWVQHLWGAMESARADRERQERRERELKAGA